MGLERSPHSVKSRKRTAMLRWLVAVFATLVVGIASCGATDDGTGVVLDIDADNFASTLREHPFVALSFTASWCGHCKRLDPEWAKAAEILATHANDPPIVLGQVECTADKNARLTKDLGITAFPTIKVFRDGSADGEDYDGPRVADGIVDALRTLAAPIVEKMRNVDEVRAFVRQDPVVMLAAFQPGAAEGLKVYESAARRAEIRFGLVTDASLLPELDTPVDGNVVLMYRSFDERLVRFDMDFTVENLKRFVDTKSIPLVAELDKTPENRNILRRVFESRAPKVIAFVNFNDARERDGIKSAMKDIAEAGDTKYRFVLGDSAENEAAIKYFGVSPELLPAVVLHETETDKKFILHRAEPKGIASWLAKYDVGSLDPSFRSEEPPKSNNGAVKVVVAKTFEKLVTGSKTDVLIEFYAPWCGHCKKFAPVMEKVGQKFASNDALVIAKMDATANDVLDRRFLVKAYPTLYFYQAKNDKVILYDGDRSEMHLVRFLMKHSGQKKSQKDDL